MQQLPKEIANRLPEEIEQYILELASSIQHNLFNEEFLKKLGPPPSQRIRVEDGLLLNRQEYIQYIKNKAFELDDITNLEFTPTELDFDIFEITQEDLPEIVKVGRSLYEFYQARMIRVKYDTC